MYLFTLKLLIMYHQRYIGLFSFRGKLAARRRHPQRKLYVDLLLPVEDEVR